MQRSSYRWSPEYQDTWIWCILRVFLNNFSTADGFVHLMIEYPPEFFCLHFYLGMSGIKDCFWFKPLSYFLYPVHGYNPNNSSLDLSTVIKLTLLSPIPWQFNPRYFNVSVSHKRAHKPFSENWTLRLKSSVLQGVGVISGGGDSLHRHLLLFHPDNLLGNLPVLCFYKHLNVTHFA